MNGRALQSHGQIHRQTRTVIHQDQRALRARSAHGHGRRVPLSDPEATTADMNDRHRQDDEQQGGKGRQHHEGPSHVPEARRGGVTRSPLCPCGVGASRGQCAGHLDPNHVLVDRFPSLFSCSLLLLFSEGSSSGRSVSSKPSLSRPTRGSSTDSDTDKKFCHESWTIRARGRRGRNDEDGRVQNGVR